MAKKKDEERPAQTEDPKANDTELEESSEDAGDDDDVRDEASDADEAEAASDADESGDDDAEAGDDDAEDEPVKAEPKKAAAASKDAKAEPKKAEPKKAAAASKDAKAEPKKAAAAAADKKNGKGTDKAAAAAASDKGASKKDDKPAKEKEPKKPAASSDLDAGVSEDLRTLFGLQAADDKLDDVADYEPDGRTGASVGSILGLLVVVAAVVGLIVGAVQILKKRQDEIDEDYKKRQAEAEATVEPEVRYGNIALLASEPPRALVLQNGKPIYVRTPDGAYTELRVAPDTRIQNVKIEEGATVRYALESEGFRPYEIALNEYSWTPIPGSADWEKVYTKIRLEPVEERLLPNCDEIQALGEGYASACLVSRSDEVLTRQDYERVYVDPTTEVPVVLTGTLTIDSEPQGAKIFFNSRPLLTPEGTQAVTPYTFSEYKLGAPVGDALPTDAPAVPGDAPAAPGGDAPAAPAGEAPATPAGEAPAAPTAAPADVLKKVSVTGVDSDGRLSVRLEKDGLAPYKTAVWPHSWKCTPQTDVSKIKEIVRPKKSEASAADLIHHLCSYSLTIGGKLHEPPPPPKPGEKGADGAPASPEPTAP